MVKKGKQKKNSKKVTNKNSNNENKNQNNSIPVIFPYNKVTTIKSHHEQTLNCCFLSSTKKYIITCSASYLSLLDSKDFKILSKYKMYKPADYLLELKNNNIFIKNKTETFLFEVKNNFGLNLLYYYIEVKDFEEMGVIGCGQISNGNILAIIPYSIKYYRQTKEKPLELYDTFKFNKIIKILIFDYGTQFKSSFIFPNNNDFICLLTYQELYIINHQKKNLVKKIDIKNNHFFLLKHINLGKDYTLIYHQKKILMFNNNNYKILSNYVLNDEKENITCIEILNKNNLLACGTNKGKIYILNYIQMKKIREISFNNQIFNIFWIKELNDNLIVNNIPKSKISFSNYNSGEFICELDLTNSSNYRRGIYLKDTNKLLLGCAKSFAVIE